MALMLCAVVLFKMKRQRYAWWRCCRPAGCWSWHVPTAGWQKSFSPDTKSVSAIANTYSRR
ncbi:hypothetical protein LN650_23550 [Klebsiella pneumoniae subsp. pneumoniae]|nr:hypothetical protein [Klebsiella pneumoniae subsp. pneumoniae]